VTPSLQVLALSTGLQDRCNMFWWQPTLRGEGTGGGAGVAVERRPWAPWALALEIGQTGVMAHEADNVDSLPPPSLDCTSRWEC
jgi:hypothetical protein